MPNNVIDEAYQIIEEMMMHGIKSHKVEVTRENNELIKQIRRVAPRFEGFRCSYMSCVGGKRWFVIRDYSKDITTEKSPGELILVDFKAKKVLKRAG